MERQTDRQTGRTDRDRQTETKRDGCTPLVQLCWYAWCHAHTLLQILLEMCSLQAKAGSASACSVCITSKAGSAFACSPLITSNADTALLVVHRLQAKADPASLVIHTLQATVDPSFACSFGITSRDDPTCACKECFASKKRFQHCLG